MTAYAPQTHLETHEVTNAPPLFAGRNLYAEDRGLARCRESPWRRLGRGASLALGGAAGSEEVLQWGEDANRYPPELQTFDRLRPAHRRGQVPSRLSSADGACDGASHSQHRLGGEACRPACRARGHAGSVQPGRGRDHVPDQHDLCERAALRHQPDVAAVWVAKIVGGVYDAPLRPIAEKRGVTVGMAMTEKQGGSDVRANTTRAFPLGDGGPGRSTGSWATNGSAPRPCATPS